jgi:hypothetical protein
MLRLALLALATVAVAAQNNKQPWKLGRATFYGKDGWCAPAPRPRVVSPRDRREAAPRMRVGGRQYP